MYLPAAPAGSRHQDGGADRGGHDRHNGGDLRGGLDDGCAGIGACGAAESADERRRTAGS